MAIILVHRPTGMRYTMLREELLRAFGWDHCSAYIAHKLETDTGHRLEHMQKYGSKEGLLWIEISEESLRADMLNAFSVRSIRDALAKMERPGVIVRAKERAGRVSRILYNHQLVDACVTAGVSIDSLPDFAQEVNQAVNPGRIAEVNQSTSPEALPAILPGYPGSSTGNFAGVPAEGIGKTTTVKEEELKKEKEEEPPAPFLQSQNQTPAPDLQLSDDIITFLENAYSRENRHAKLPNLRARQNESLCQNIRRVDTEWGTVEFRVAAIAYLHDHDNWLRENRWPIQTFLKRGITYIPASQNLPAPCAPAAAPATARPSEDAQGHPAPPARPRASGNDFPARWNELVPEAPVDPALMAKNPQAYQDPLFAERFDEICRKARALITAGADMKFGFLLRTEQGSDRYRWQELLADELDWMKPKSAKKPKDDFVTQARKDAIEKLEAFKRARS